MKLLIKPRAGVQVRDPVTLQHVPETGIEVEDTDTYWARRLADGDMVPVVPEKPAAAAPAKKGKE